MLFCPELIGFCFDFHKRLKTYISPEGGDLEWICPLIPCCLNLLGIVHVSSWSVVKNSLETYINESSTCKTNLPFLPIACIIILIKFLNSQITGYCTG